MDVEKRRALFKRRFWSIEGQGTGHLLHAQSARLRLPLSLTQSPALNEDKTTPAGQESLPWLFFHSMPFQDPVFPVIFYEQKITQTVALGDSVVNCRTQQNWTSVATYTTVQVRSGAAGPIFNITRPRNIGSACGSTGSTHQLSEVPEPILVVALRLLSVIRNRSLRISISTLAFCPSVQCHNGTMCTSNTPAMATGVSLSSWTQSACHSVPLVPMPWSRHVINARPIRGRN
jgi:hypothetical protein